MNLVKRMYPNKKSVIIDVTLLVLSVLWLVVKVRRRR